MVDNVDGHIVQRSRCPHQSPKKQRSNAAPQDGADRVQVSYERTLIHDELPPEELHARQLTLRADGLESLGGLLKAGATVGRVEDVMGG